MQAQPASARRPGPPRNPERTRARILRAARREFAAKGIGGARVDAIARRAGVNKRMLYHYFGSKDGLFREVLAATLADRAADVAAGPLDVAGRMRTRADFYRRSTEYVRLLMWEALERPATEPGERPERAAAYARLLQQVADDRATGALPEGLDGRMWALAELAICLVPVAFPQITRMTAGMPAGSEEFRAAHQEFLAQLAALLGTVAAAADRSPGEELPGDGRAAGPPTADRTGADRTRADPEGPRTV